MLIILRWSTKHVNFLLRVQYPLKVSKLPKSKKKKKKKRGVHWSIALAMLASQGGTNMAKAMLASPRDANMAKAIDSIPGGYSTLSWVRMCGPKFRPPPYNKTKEDANLLPISKPFVSWRALFKTNQCFLQCKLGCISTFWQPIDKPKDKFIGNYAFCKNATYRPI